MALDSKRTRVMIVDDHPIILVGLREILEGSGDFEVVGEAHDGEEAIAELGRMAPDVIVMEQLMPGKGGADVCREIIGRDPAARIMMLTASLEEDAVIESIAAGATGYLQKNTDKAGFLDAVRDVSEGRIRIPDKILRQVIARIRRAPLAPHQDPSIALKVREQQILGLFATGKSYAQIAEVMGNSPVSIRNAIYRIQRKLGTATKQEMVVWAVRHGLLDDK